MKRLVAVTMPIAAAFAIAACGSGGSTSTPSAGTTPASGSATASRAASGSSSSTVSLKQVSGIGNVLVDSDGMALYTPNQEPDTSKILCTANAGCTSFWKPLLVSSQVGPRKSASARSCLADIFAVFLFRGHRASAGRPSGRRWHTC